MIPINSIYPMAFNAIKYSWFQNMWATPSSYLMSLDIINSKILEPSFEGT